MQARRRGPRQRKRSYSLKPGVRSPAAKGSLATADRVGSSPEVPPIEKHRRDRPRTSKESSPSRRVVVSAGNRSPWNPRHRRPRGVRGVGQSSCSAIPPSWDRPRVGTRRPKFHLGSSRRPRPRRRRQPRPRQWARLGRRPSRNELGAPGIDSAKGCICRGSGQPSESPHPNSVWISRLSSVSGSSDSSTLGLRELWRAHRARVLVEVTAARGMRARGCAAGRWA
jgi:hypothetical protein